MNNATTLCPDENILVLALWILTFDKVVSILKYGAWQFEKEVRYL